MKTIAILGANGRLGLTTVNAFHQAGWAVIAVTRNGHYLGPEPVENRAADARSSVALEQAVKDCDVVFNGLNPLYPRWHTEALPLTENVINACLSTGATHLFPGNVYNYGHSIPAIVEPSTLQVGGTKKGKIRVEIERMLLRATKDEGLQTLVLRAGDFFGGKGTGSWFDLAITSQFRSGKIVYPGNRNLPHAWAYLPDLSRTFVALAEQRAKCAMYDEFLFEGYSLTGNRLHEHLETASDRKLKEASIPWTLFKLGSLFNAMWRETLEMRYLWNTPHQLDGSKLQAFCPELTTTPPEVALKEALQDLDLL
ncbi:NAD(P)H-binding protein [Alphaproteobacteria bacterium]|nr:NAD(P)H-binding protein [Alphaproteobacteria bacterium]